MTSFIRRSPLALLSFLGALFFVLVAVSRAASPYVIDVWTPYQGLPQSRVLSIAQTPDGYLWVGTKLGWLARFEGIRFTSFGPENTPALGSPEIHKLLVDDAALPYGVRVKDLLFSPANGLWIATDQGLWNRHQGVISRVPLTYSENGMALSHLAEKANGGLWMMSPGRVSLLRDRVIVRSV